VKLISSHVANGYGTIEWIFGGKDVGVYKTGKPFAVRGVSVIEVRGAHISRNLDYYDAATIMKQVGKLPAA
jgi:ketosteroid isomerase-like protein